MKNESSPDYPFGDSIEPYDIEREKEMMDEVNYRIGRSAAQTVQAALNRPKHWEHAKGIIAITVLAAAFLWSAHGDAQVMQDTSELPPTATQENVSEQKGLLTPEPVEATAQVTVEVVKPNVIREVSAYTSEVAQTDSTPCISANGSNICQLYVEGTNICASNAYPMGTVLEVDGLGTCIVADRMNARYRNRVDWYMGMDTARALRFGVQKLRVTDI